MSGTSFDGVDAALIKTDGENYIKFIGSAFLAYSKKEKHLYKKSILNNINFLTKAIDDKHIEVIKLLLKKTNIKIRSVNLIGLHGQTFFHKPEEKWSWQYINSEKLLKVFKKNIISDFRLNDINNGGEGAPLVPIFHAKLIKKFIKESPIAILNIGGVCNVTIVNKDETFLGFDIGPGNGPIDSIVFNKFSIDFDKGGNISKKGKVYKSVSKSIIFKIEKLVSNKSYDRKTLDKICINETKNMNVEDALATILNSISELTYKKIKAFNVSKLILVGGGRKNLTLKNLLNKKFKNIVIESEELGWEGDSIEAQAFAYLAVRCYLGYNITFPETTGIRSPLSGGVLHSYLKYD